MAYDRSVYQAHGFNSREDYIDSLRDEYGAEIVDAICSTLPESEDFDGLVTTLEEIAEMGEDAWIEMGASLFA